VVTRQLQVEGRTGKVRRPKTDVLPLCHATNQWAWSGSRDPFLNFALIIMCGIGEARNLKFLMLIDTQEYVNDLEGRFC